MMFHGSVRRSRVVTGLVTGTSPIFATVVAADMTAKEGTDSTGSQIRRSIFASLRHDDGIGQDYSVLVNTSL